MKIKTCVEKRLVCMLKIYEPIILIIIGGPIWSFDNVDNLHLDNEN